MERKFTHKVAIRAGLALQRDLKMKAYELGYEIDDFDPGDEFRYPIVIANGPGWGGCCTNVVETFKHGGTEVENPELFLALAAMSEGADFYPGECVFNCFDGANDFAIVTDWAGEKKYFLETDGVKYIVHGTHLRKATAEEIIAHFEFMSTADKIIKEAQGEGVIGSADHTNSLQYKANEFADKMKLSNALRDWIPKPFEPIWVWNNGTDKLRHKMLFAFFSENTVFAFEEQFATWSNFPVHEWQNFAKVDDPVVIPHDEIVSHFAKQYGVPVELIEIGKKP